VPQFAVGVILGSIYCLNEQGVVLGALRGLICRIRPGRPRSRVQLSSIDLEAGRTIPVSSATRLSPADPGALGAGMWFDLLVRCHWARRLAGGQSRARGREVKGMNRPRCCLGRGRYLNVRSTQRLSLGGRE
jgi:hypothetical protein